MRLILEGDNTLFLKFFALLHFFIAAVDIQSFILLCSSQFCQFTYSSRTWKHGSKAKYLTVQRFTLSNTIQLTQELQADTGPKPTKQDRHYTFRDAESTSFLQALGEKIETGTSTCIVSWNTQHGWQMSRNHPYFCCFSSVQRIWCYLHTLAWNFLKFPDVCIHSTDNKVWNVAGRRQALPKVLKGSDGGLYSFDDFNFAEQKECTPQERNTRDKDTFSHTLCQTKLNHLIQATLHSKIGTFGNGAGQLTWKNLALIPALPEGQGRKTVLKNHKFVPQEKCNCFFTTHIFLKVVSLGVSWQNSRTLLSLLTLHSAANRCYLDTKAPSMRSSIRLPFWPNHESTSVFLFNNQNLDFLYSTF